MIDSFHEVKKKEYERWVIDHLIGRTYPMGEVSDQRKKVTIFNEGEVFYRDHIEGLLGSEASYHNVKQRFPSLNEEIKVLLSEFAEKMRKAGDSQEKMEAVFREYGLSISFSSDKLKTLMKNG